MEQQQQQQEDTAVHDPATQHSNMAVALGAVGWGGISENTALAALARGAPHHTGGGSGAAAAAVAGRGSVLTTASQGARGGGGQQQPRASAERTNSAVVPQVRRRRLHGPATASHTHTHLHTRTHTHTRAHTCIHTCAHTHTHTHTLTHTLPPPQDTEMHGVFANLAATAAAAQMQQHAQLHVAAAAASSLSGMQGGAVQQHAHAPFLPDAALNHGSHIGLQVDAQQSADGLAPGAQVRAKGGGGGMHDGGRSAA